MGSTLAESPPKVLKVLHVPRTLDDDAGGPPMVVQGICTALREQGVQCEVATTHGSRTHGKPVQLPGIAVHSFPASPLASVWNGHAQGLWRFLQRNASRFDLIHIHEPWHYSSCAAYVAAQRAGVPLMVSIHGAMMAGALRRKRQRKFLYLNLVQRRMLNAMGAVHTLAPAETQALSALGVRCPFFQAPNGVSREMLRALDAAPVSPLIERHPQLAGRRVILFLGRIIARKGLIPLAEAFIALARRHPDAMLLVAGEPQDDTAAQARAALHRAGLRQRAVFAGMLTGADKLAALRLADIFALPSQFEGFSAAILEALAARLPVVISAGCNFPEVAEHQAGCIAPTTPEALAGTLDTLLGDASLRARMGANGRRMIEQHYTWSTISAAFAQRYREICNAQ